MHYKSLSLISDTYVDPWREHSDAMFNDEFCFLNVGKRPLYLLNKSSSERSISYHSFKLHMYCVNNQSSLSLTPHEWLEWVKENYYVERCKWIQHINIPSVRVGLFYPAAILHENTEHETAHNVHPVWQSGVLSCLLTSISPARRRSVSLDLTDYAIFTHRTLSSLKLTFCPAKMFCETIAYLNSSSLENPT